MRALIVGCGYVGLPLGAELVRLGHAVSGLRRSALAEAELLAAGIQPLHADITRPETLAKLPRNFDWVVNCTASGGGGADDYRKVYLEGNRNLIAHLGGSPLKKFVYTSSTSVYAQNDGSAVTENCPVEPEADTAKVLVEAEKLLQEAALSLTRWEREERSQLSDKTGAASGSTGINSQESNQRLPPFPAGEGKGEGENGIQPEAGGSRGRSAQQSGFPAVILRVAGIYGPGRGYAFKQFLRGAARMEGNGERVMNMIHRDDLIGIIIAALEHGLPGEIYNAADNAPVSQRDFYAWLAGELKQPMPPKIAADAEAWRKRGVTNKCVSNAKLRAELGYMFKFPDFRAGYALEVAKMRS